MENGRKASHSTEAPFPQSLIDAFRRHPASVAFEHRSRAVTRGEVLSLVTRCAAGLRAAGLGPGRSLALATDVTPEGFAVQIAAHLLGCRVTGLRPGLTPSQLAHVLATDVDAVVTDAVPARPELLRAAGGAPVLRLERDLLAAHPHAGPLPGDGLVARGRPGDEALVHLTSGSTGHPKGCVLDYRALTAYWSWQPARWDDRVARLAAGYRRFLLFGTLTSAVMFEHLGLCLLGGGTAVIPAAPLEFPRVIERLRITALLMTVPRLHRVLDALRTGPGRATDLSGLRVLIVAGSPLAPHALAEAVERVGTAVHQAYGQTETGMLTLLTPDDLAHGPAGAATSVGRPWARTELSVRDAEGVPVPTGGTGEVWARTPCAMSGYWRDATETAQVLRDGWVRTRDVGHLDARGFLHLTGRSRDIVIVDAVVHYCGAVEQALTTHPDVDRAYVVAAADRRTGEAAHAFVVAAPGATPALDSVRARVEAELGVPGLPSTLTVVTDVPVTPSGKPDKRALLARVPTEAPPATGAR
ncbi:class I adenylate-forming enzyme family protein [Streptomyces spectabilis]|uniref:Acyl-CoA synthetase (AMP-forming)/AMP-acid ligase II n=1 Tax=Streptomyces spectabilis TaxID=68270 RepID=A0A5P2X5K1_STRST|nr:fatty acid--CoA ligase family protein [Streptomyces spectabilis]MBB5101592.1 acyl-CoA synthetase (AMP-forming)/AMP-acid ligase II [Streptomyces spectabilis]MCI3900775.1 fatty acid--CoA ligase family protein [Streptomyces spectabilis]QEV58310.1 long-chain fatty acid--CoA ligase [Streptomyces spectabilis]GGV12379.1 AMP-dependent synthetase [Streptomyces spectabilis]